MPSPKQWSQEDLPASLRKAIELAVDKNGRAPVVLNVTDIVGYTDWLLIVSGRSERHVAGISSGIAGGLRDGGYRPRGRDGESDHRWDLLDYDDFIIHVFYHPVRLHYDLESMLSDAARAKLGLPPDVMSTDGLDSMAADTVLPAYRGDLDFGGYEDEFTDHEVDEVEDPETA
jgi:ribosome silencing factor RsfS/YbeB/iojap